MISSVPCSHMQPYPICNTNVAILALGIGNVNSRFPTLHPRLTVFGSAIDCSRETHWLSRQPIRLRIFGYER